MRMNRKDTQLLVESWRKLLREAYSHESEQFEPGSIDYEWSECEQDRYPQLRKEVANYESYSAFRGDLQYIDEVLEEARGFEDFEGDELDIEEDIVNDYLDSPFDMKAYNNLGGIIIEVKGKYDFDLTREEQVLAEAVCFELTSGGGSPGAEGSVSGDDRVFLSEGELDMSLLRGVSQGGEASMKPKGLWYSFGNGWQEFSRKNNFNMQKYSHKYVLEVDESKICKIGSVSELKAFEEKYYKKESSGMDGIDWKSVADDGFCGFEVKNYGSLKGEAIYNGDTGSSWLDFWDIDSGCIWDGSAIKGHRKV